MKNPINTAVMLWLRLAVGVFYDVSLLGAITMKVLLAFLGKELQLPRMCELNGGMMNRFNFAKSWVDDFIAHTDDHEDLEGRGTHSSCRWRHTHSVQG